MQNYKRVLLFLIMLLGSLLHIAHAEEAPSANLIVRDGGNILFESTVPLQPAGQIDLNGHSLDADSVLSVLHDADLSSENFSITDLQYYDSMGSFYLKCINDKCDYWQYVVNDSYPGIGMDKKILSGGEEVYVYFSPQHKVSLSSHQITNAESVTVTAENYAYRTDTWEPLVGGTIGVTQPNPSDPFSPTELQTLATDASGKVVFSGLATGSYNIGIKEDFYFPTEALTVTDPVEPPPSGGGSGGGNIIVSQPATPKSLFDTDKAFEFLVKEQKEDGTFGEELYTDWAALALMNSDKFQETKIKLIKYYTSAETKGKLLTDFERRAMAVMTLGLNPYSVNGENYIEKITAGFDGTQFGDQIEDNDDIFALLVLQNAGFKGDEEIIQKTISFILSKQKPNGSWNGSVDITGAAMESLASFNKDPLPTSPLAGGEEISKALEKAKSYLQEKQNADGGWGNVSSTAWAMQGILSLGEKPADWKKNEKTPFDFLALNQDKDGGIKNLPALPDGREQADEDLNNRIWQTSYVLSAATGKTWVETMQKFDPVKSHPRLANATVTSGQPAFKGTKTKNETLSAPATTPPTIIEETSNDSPIEYKKESGFKNLLRTVFGFFF